MSKTLYPFERLDCYRLSVEVARWVRAVRWPSGEADLHKQARDAADSVVLDIAEGSERRGKSGRNHFAIAKGSAGEVLAVLHLLDLEGGPENQEKLRRIGAMLHRL